MKKKNSIVIILILLCFLIVGLAYIMFRLDINDFDTQFSSSIIDSKQNGFFVQRYDTLKGESSCVRISEAWVEHIWYNKVTLFKQSKEKKKGLDLLIKIDTGTFGQLGQVGNYDKWQLVIKSNKEIMGKEYSGSKIRNCHYYPFDAVLPDTLTILFEERAQPKDTFKVVSQIKLVKAQ